MKICFLTQTATDIPDYYKSFFKEKDLFFITFKNPNPDALAFVPKSTWSDGRNKLWNEVRDKYDYYVFIDDDLLFYNFNPKFTAFPFLSYLYYRYKKKELPKCYKPADRGLFFSRLEYYLSKFKPEVLSATHVSWDPNDGMDAMAMRRNSFVRRIGYFDAQFTVLSNYAASKLLPYDTKISGWWSSQIPVYLYSYHVFALKAINVCEIGVNNSQHVGAYVENYDGIRDCKIMLDQISKATKINYNQLAGAKEGEAIKTVDVKYGTLEIMKKIPRPNDIENYKLNYEKNMKGLENFLHQNCVI